MNSDVSTPRHYVEPGSPLPFSAAVQVGDILYLSGQIGMGADGRLPDGIEAQTHRMMANIAAAAALAGVGLSDIFKCTVMLADISEWDAFNDVYRTYFPADRLPARSAFAASGLALGARVEMECLAFVNPVVKAGKPIG